jgi:hypothetical protein
MDRISSRASRTLVALVGAAVIIAIARWFDSDVITGIQQRAGADFDATPAAVATSLGYLMIAAGALLIVFLARRAAYPEVGVLYAAGGAFLTFLFPLTWFLTVHGNSPAILTGPVADFLDSLWTKTEQGPLGAVPILGAVMFLVGLLEIGSIVRNREHVVPAVAVTPLETKTITD